MGNRLGEHRCEGASEMEVTIRWTDGKPWEIAWGERGKE